MESKTTSQRNTNLPSISTGLSAEEILSTLHTMSKKGNLAGFEAEGPHGYIAVAAHGTPFDSKLLIHHEEDILRFELRLIRMFPTIFLVLLIITIWPGLPLTDGFMSSFQWYEQFVASTGILTWYWYLPLTILPAPFAWKSSIKKSKASAVESAYETIEKLRAKLG